MREQERRRFDDLLERVLADLPDRIAALLEEVSLVVMDRPDAEMVRALRADGTIGPDEDGSDLCGLHTGVAITERSVEDVGVLPNQIHLFREGVVATAGDAGRAWARGGARVEKEIRITLLHEIGHHFGLDEDDLEALGYG